MNLPYKEGSIFLVPLRSGGYSRGVVARMAPKGQILFGYFFGPRTFDIEICLDEIRPERSMLRVRFGDLGLINGNWRVISTVRDWQRSDWPIIRFMKIDPLNRIPNKMVTYSDKDPSVVLEERHYSGEYLTERDALHGYIAVEKILDKKLFV